MANRIKGLIKYGVAIGIGLFIIFKFIFPDKGVMQNISTAISTTTICMILYCNYLWRYMPKLVRKVPKLYGEWNGIIKSSYDGFDKTFEFKIIIKQTLLNIYIDLLTDESKSVSITGELIKDNKNDYILIYSYRNEPIESVKNRSQIHYGTAKLSVVNDGELKGGYFTDRKTTGNMILKKNSN